MFKDTKTSVITAIVAIVVSLAISAFAIISYINTHTWATISCSCEVGGKAGDTVTQEVLKGDSLLLPDGVSVNIDHISHGGRVRLTFAPPVLDRDGDELETTELELNQSIDVHYTSGSGDISATIAVTDHRYQ